MPSEEGEKALFRLFAHGLLQGPKSAESSDKCEKGIKKSSEKCEKGIEETSEAPRAAAAKAKQKAKKESKDEPERGYNVDSPEVEANRDESEKLIQELATFRASAQAMTNEVFTGEDSEKWIKAAQKELDNMSNVWHVVRRNHVHEDLSLDPKTKLPRAIPMKLVNTLKPSSDPSSGSPAEPKVRLVACGNFEGGAGSSGDPEEFSTQNVDPVCH